VGAAMKINLGDLIVALQILGVEMGNFTPIESNFLEINGSGDLLLINSSDEFLEVQ
jgi:hypothetical protein